MIRAHMASFPPRRDLMLRNIGAILGQVDRLFLVLNQFDRVPDEILGNERIVAVIPEEDLMDVGKFYFRPDPEDLVFTVDDDLVYPADYVAHMRSFTAFMDMNRMLIGLHGYSVDPDRLAYTRFFHFRAGIKSIRGVGRLGTGVAMMKGSACPPLADMRGAEGYVDVRFASWQVKRGNLMWIVPHTRGWVKGNAPKELEPHSLTARFLSQPTQKLIEENLTLLHLKAANDGLRYYQWKRAQH
jgi:hypothetical protein